MKERLQAAHAFVDFLDEFEVVLDVVAEAMDGDEEGQGERGDPNVALGLELALELVGVLVPAALRPAANANANGQRQRG